MGRFRFISTIIIMTLLVMSITGCGSVKDDDSTDDSFSGLFNLGITDAPLDGVNKVIVEFTGIEIQPASGERITINFEEPRQIDLLALNGGGREMLLDNQPLPAGHYEWIRLMVNAESGALDSYLELEDSSQCSLRIPSGDQTGLKLVRGFDIPLDGIADFTIDFDLRKSVHKPSGNNEDYMLRPTLRIVDNAEVGSITGIIDPALIIDQNNPPCMVYIFEGEDVVPDDIDGTEPEPVTVAEVKYNNETGQYFYEAFFLNAGDYTLALTYEAQEDDPEIDDEINFVESAQVTVANDTAKQCDFAE